MKQQRKFVRVALRAPVTYQVFGQRRHAMTRDLTRGGMSLELREFLQPGRVIDGEMQLPNRERPVSFRAKVIACERVETATRLGREEFFQARAMFAEMDPDEEQAIRLFLDSVLR